MSSKLSDFVRLSPLEAVLVVLLGRFRLPARYEEPEVMDERIERLRPSILRSQGGPRG